MNVLDHYLASAPCPQNAVDIFRGEWASKFPGPLADVAAGSAPLFEDPRILWAVEQMGGVRDRTILELGPLEAGHTFMLERAGAASVLAVEANTRAYLKCLVAKELTGITRSQFVCGDFVEYLRGCGARFDACVASGVLYHMRDPLELLGLLSRVSDRIFIWTHYFDAAVIKANSTISKKFPSHAHGEYGGFRCEYHRYEYQQALDYQGFCGGPAPYSHWIKREDILACLRHFGFGNVQTSFEQPDHQNGPAFALLATRAAVPAAPGE